MRKRLRWSLAPALAAVALGAALAPAWAAPPAAAPPAPPPAAAPPAPPAPPPAALPPAAPPVDDATRQSARKLGEEAKELFDRGDFAGALDKYNRADALVHVPTIGVRAARTLERMGRLIEAGERYLEVTRMELPVNAPALHKEALIQAEDERNALLPRIPSVVIALVGEVRDAVVTVDGQTLPEALLGAKRAVNPGHHEIAAAREGRVIASDSIDVVEGETRNVLLNLPAVLPTTPVLPCTGPACIGTPASTATAAAPVATGPAPIATLAPPPPASPLRTVGFIGLGVGAAAVLAGGALGIVALVRGEALAAPSKCGPKLECPRQFDGDADSYNNQRVFSAAGFWGGLVLAGAGVALVWAAPSSRKLAVSAGGGSLHIRGEF
jgi:hypothetical protein